MQIDTYLAGVLVYLETFTVTCLTGRITALIGILIRIRAGRLEVVGPHILLFVKKEGLGEIGTPGGIHDFHLLSEKAVLYFMLVSEKGDGLWLG